MGLARRSLTSVSWNVAANTIGTMVVFGRSIILARWLPVEVFGLYAGWRAIIGITVTLVDFGLSGAFIHHAPETEDEEKSATSHFTLRFSLVSAWVLLMTVGILLFSPPDNRFPFLVLTWSTAILQQTQTAQVILLRRVQHRRLAVLSILTAFLTTIAAILWAWLDASIWAILVTDLISTGIAVTGFYFLRPVWKPKFGWYPSILRYYLSFGSKSFLAVTLYNLLDRVDDLWTRFSLGEVAMGFYSRAYRFATSPRTFLASPITSVIGGTYAELKYDRVRLSQAFFRTNAFLVRSGFLLAGLLALIAPEFIRIFLTDKWLPMLEAFRLMLVFTLFDPLKLAISNVLGAMGRPEIIVKARFIQLIILVAGLVLLSPRWGIAGVAVAVDVMLVVGIAILFWQVRVYVDFSLQALFTMPLLALIVGVSLAFVALISTGSAGNDWMSGSIKLVVFSISYLGVLWLTERRQVIDMVHQMVHSLRSA